MTLKVTTATGTVYLRCSASSLATAGRYCYDIAFKRVQSIRNELNWDEMPVQCGAFILVACERTSCSVQFSSVHFVRSVRASYPVYTIEQTSSRHRADIEQTSSRPDGTPPLGL